MILSSCSKEEGMFTLDPNVTPVAGDLSNDFNLEEDKNIVSSSFNTESYEYVGQVVTKKGETPISNAIVEIYSIDKNGGKIAKTDVNGVFKLKLNVEKSKVNIQVKKAGYVTQVVNLSDLFENKVKLEYKRKPVSDVKYTSPTGSSVD